MFSADDHKYMTQALRLAAHGLYSTDPNPRVGCVIVKDRAIVGQGWHRATGEPHAEANALEEAGENTRDATAYVTLEPCSHHGRTPPCADALIKAGVARVVVAAQDPSPKVAGQGMARLKAEGVTVEFGLMQEQAAQLNPGFISRFSRGRPYVRAKLAMSLDGRTAMANGESKWITSEAARDDVHRLRARSSVIVTGIGTVLADNPRMNARIHADLKQPDRVVVDTNLRMPSDAAMFKQLGLTWLANDCGDERLRSRLQQSGARLLDLATRNGTVDLNALLNALSDLEYNEVLVEAGPTLSGAFMQAGLVDELIVYQAPHMMGDGGNPLMYLPGIQSMQNRLELKMTELRHVGNDLRLSYVLADRKNS